MCGKVGSCEALIASRTLRAGITHCRIREKCPQKQPTDRAAHCGLLSGPLSVGFCAPPLSIPPSSRKPAVLRLPTKSPPEAPVRPNEAMVGAMPDDEAQADWRLVTTWVRANGTITASAPLRKPRRTGRRIAVRLPRDRARQRQPARRSMAVWMSRDRQVQRLPAA